MYKIREESKDFPRPVLFKLLDSMEVGQEFDFPEGKRQLLQYHKRDMVGKKFITRRDIYGGLVCKRIK